jgi:hypothetical protein
MRILHTITTIERGGAENQLLLLVREQIKKGHEVTVLPLKGDLELKDSFLGYGAKIEASICKLGIISQILTLFMHIYLEQRFSQRVSTQSG